MVTTTSACSECSDLKEQLGHVTRRLEAQEVQVDTLRQLMESLRSSTLTVPPVPSPPGAMQTSTPVESPPSIFHAPSTSSATAALHPPAVCSPTGPPADPRLDPTSPAVASMASSPHPPPSSMPNLPTPIAMHAESIAPEFLQMLWAPTVVEDTHPPRSPSSASDDHVPPACPPPSIINTDDAIAVDQPAASVPAIPVSPFNLPAVPYLYSLQAPITPGDDHPPSLCPPNSTSADGMALDPEAIPLPTIVVSPTNVPNDTALAPAVSHTKQVWYSEHGR